MSKFAHQPGFPHAPDDAPPGVDQDDVVETIKASAGETETIGHAKRGLPMDSDDDVHHQRDESGSDSLDGLAPSDLIFPQIGDRIVSVDGHHTFVLNERLGAGVSCFVFRGIDEVTGQQVAAKIVNWENVYDRTAALRQMRTEAAALARVKHPKVVRFIDFGFDPRWPYLVTEYVDGRALGELLRTGGALPTEWAIYLISQVVEGLGAVWRAGLVHRDIKPDNILVLPDGSAKLIDFGLAKAPVLQANSGQTGPELAGTAAYLSPEQAKDASIVDLRADIYSLGVTFYEALTGRLPFEGRNRVQMIFQHINSAPVPPADRVPGLPEVISDLCMWMLAKSADERPQDYESLRSGFDTIMEN